MTERLSMRTIRDILRQRWVLGRPHRAIGLSCGRSVGAVYEALRRARAAGLDWAQVEPMTDTALEAALYRRPAAGGPQRERPQPDCVYLHTERRKPGVTLELLHLEYLERHADGYRYTQFCEVARCGSDEELLEACFIGGVVQAPEGGRGPPAASDNHGGIRQITRSWFLL
jgi:hypothetical protein